MLLLYCSVQVSNSLHSRIYLSICSHIDPLVYFRTRGYSMLQHTFAWLHIVCVDVSWKFVWIFQPGDNSLMIRSHRGFVCNKWFTNHSTFKLIYYGNSCCCVIPVGVNCWFLTPPFLMFLFLYCVTTQLSTRLTIWLMLCYYVN